MRELAVGDKITVEYEVQGLDIGDYPILASRVKHIHRGNYRFARDEVVTHTPKPREFKERDLVRLPEYPDYLFHVEAVRHNCAWVASTTGGVNIVRNVVDLRHAEPSDAT